MPNTARSILETHGALVGFLLKMAAIYAVWFVAYDLWLLPDGRLDEALSRFVASAAGAVLSLFYTTAAVDGRVVWATPTAGVSIVNGCNGLAALSLFVGFVIAYPGRWRRRLLFIPLGLALIVATNILRTVSLTVVQDLWPASFDQVHGMHALFVFYVVIFALWVLWANWGDADRPSAASAITATA